MARKILFIYYQNVKPNGVSKVLSNLTWELKEDGLDIEILYLMAPHEDYFPVHPSIKKHYINSFGNKFSKLGVKIAKSNKLPKSQNIYSYLYDLGSYQTLDEWIKKNHHQYETIVTCWYKLSTMLAMNKEVQKKTIAWEHISYSTGGLLWYKTLRKHYKNLKAVICINKGGMNHYHAMNSHTYFIPNLADSHLENLEYIPPYKKEDLISLVSRLDPEKNIAEFIEIFANADVPNSWHVEIMGKGNEKDKLQKLIDHYKLSDRVKLVGFGSSENVYQLMSRSKIFCFTSTVEAFGLVLMEAMFCSNALISYDCNYGPSDIVNENNGFLIPLHDKKMFTEKLELLTKDSNVLNNLMKSSFDESKNWRKEKTLALWKEVLK